MFEDDYQNPLIHQADIVFEHTIAKNTVVSASGLFSWGRNLPTFVDSNIGSIVGTTTYNVNGGPFSGQTVTVNNYDDDIVLTLILMQLRRFKDH